MAEELFAFGDWVRLRRQALVLTREDLAGRVGCAEVTIRKIESDERKPSPQVAALLAQHLGLAADQGDLFVRVARGFLPVAQLPPAIPGAPVASMPVAPTVSPAATLPSGTVTFLFTDIEGSTRRWEEQPAAMRGALARHDALLRADIMAHGGAVVKRTGDGMHAVFARATDAVHAALAAQRSLVAEAWGPIGLLGVRMALHTGVTQERDGDYFGPPLNRVARLLAAGHGQQVLLSLATATLVQDQLPSGVSVRDLGERHLKDLARPEHVFQLLAPDLPAAFPPLRALETWPNNLPAQLTSFVGRAQEGTAVAALLASQRLVTLTGPGGTGKTRLALHVAADQREQFANGVWLVELAPLADPLLVPQAVANVLGLREEAGRLLLTVLTDYLRTRTLLLVLDNCEHLVDACAQLAETLLRACPQLRILASSREALGVAGEAPFRVPPLSTPDSRQLPELEAFAQYEAVRLFTERATTVLSSFQVTPENMAAVAHICSRLDGIPLALELAAARVKVLRVEQIVARLDDRFRLLTGTSRSALPRQQTLRALIDWSYDLLSAPEQQVLRSLAVCAGGWTLEAAEAVCIEQGLEQEDVLDVVSRLVDKSLVQVERVLEQEARYGMLETIRQYALERLAASGEADVARRRHAAHFLVLAETAAPHLEGREQGVWLDRLELEHDNLRAALGWALGGGDVAVGARIALALAGHDWSSFWHLRGHGSEALRWLDHVVEQPNQLTPAQQAWALLLANWFREGLYGIAWDQGFAVSDQALALFREAGDRAGIAWVIVSRGGNAWFRGDYAQATQLLEEALALYQQIDQHDGIARALHDLGNVARDSGDGARASQLLGESLAVCQSEGYVERTTLVLCGMGDVPCIQGDFPRATALYWESLLSFEEEQHFSQTKIYPLRNLGFMVLLQGADERVLALLQQAVAWWRDKGNQVGFGLLNHMLGVVLYSAGKAEEGLAILREALTLQVQLGQTYLVLEIIELLAGIALGQGHIVQAARLLAAATALRRAHNLPGYPAARSYSDHILAATRAQLGNEAFTAAWVSGQALSLEQAIAEALAEPQRTDLSTATG